MTVIIKKNTTAKEFNKILKEMQKKKAKSQKGFDAKKYCGAIKSFENLDPNKLQEELRNGDR